MTPYVKEHFSYLKECIISIKKKNKRYEKYSKRFLAKIMKILRVFFGGGVGVINSKQY